MVNLPVYSTLVDSYSQLYFGVTVQLKETHMYCVLSPTQEARLPRNCRIHVRNHQRRMKESFIASFANWRNQSPVKYLRQFPLLR